jgi:hypothetical protein
MPLPAGAPEDDSFFFLLPAATMAEEWVGWGVDADEPAPVVTAFFPCSRDGCELDPTASSFTPLLG